MTRKFFYTRLRRNGMIAAVRVKGYSDGVFNYYRNQFGRWHAVHPTTGLSAAYAHTRRECQNKAFDNLEKIEEYMHEHGDHEIKVFSELEKIVEPDFEI